MPAKMPAAYVVKGFNQGQSIFQEGQDGSYACIINSGKVRVSKQIDGRPVVLAELGRGQVFGEMALLASEKRTATVAALEYTEVVVVDRGHLEKIMASSNPMMQTLVKGLVLRLAATTEMVRKSLSPDEQFVALAHLLQGVTENLQPLRDGFIHYPMARFAEMVREIGLADRKTLEDAIRRLAEAELIRVERSSQGRDLALKSPSQLPRKAAALLSQRQVELAV